MGHGDGRQAVFIAVAHAQVHGGVGGCGLRDGVPQFIVRMFLQKLAVLGARASVFHEGRIEFPGNFRFRDPERRNVHFMPRTFVRLAARLLRRAPHEKGSAGNGGHAQGSPRCGHRFRIGFKT